MRKMRWYFLTLACVTAVGLTGCNPPAESASNSGSTTSGPAVTIDAKDAGSVPAGDGASAQKRTPSEPMKEDPAAQPAAKTETKKADPAAEPKKQPAENPAPAVAAEATEEMREKEEQSSSRQLTATQKPVTGERTPAVQTPAEKTMPANANRRATNANFVGTWTRFLDADTRKKYERMADLMKKQGRKVYPIENTLVIRGDGTFRLEDNAVVVGQTLEGRWTLKNGEVTMNVTRIDGKAPTAKQIQEIKASVSRDGKMLWRNHEEKLRYDKK